MISLNNADECAALKSRLPDIRFQPICAEIPRISDFLHAVRTCGHPVSGIANCDCVLRTSPRQVDWMLDQAARALLMMERLNISSADLKATGVSCQGFDAFLFSAGALDAVRIKTDFRIGETWWDYDLPLHFMAAGIPLAACSPLIHLDHPLRWDDEQWARNAKATRSRFGGLIGWENDEDGDEPLNAFALRCFEILRTRSAHQDDFAEKLFETMQEQFISSVQRENKLRLELDWVKLLIEARTERNWRRRVGEILCTLGRPLAGSTSFGRVCFAHGESFQRKADELSMAKVRHRRKSLEAGRNSNLSEIVP